jgi:hypothetical protein
MSRLYIKMLSKNTKINFLKKGWNMWFIRLWKVEGALVSPKGITKNS